MKNILIISTVICICSFYKSQVGINTQNPGSTLEVNGSLATPYKRISSSSYQISQQDQYLDYRGDAPATWQLPLANVPTNFGGRIYEIRNGSNFDVSIKPQGAEKIDVSNNANDQLVLTIPAGYYATVKSTGNAVGATWTVTFLSTIIPISSQSPETSVGFSNSILGYQPVKVSAKTVPAIFGGVNVTEIGCKKWTENGHTYCAYQLGGSKNFYETFTFAKQVGGYVITMTSDKERTWVNTNLLASGTGYDLNDNIWIGYNKVAYPGNEVQFTWITGEDWTIDWTTSPNSTPNSFFASGEPNNSGGNEGSCHIYCTVGNTERRWNDLKGSTTVFTGKNFGQIILEFNED